MHKKSTMVTIHFPQLDDSPEHCRLLERAVAHFQSDARVVGLMVSGSIATGGVDTYSDIDLEIYIRDEEFDDRPAGIALGCSYTEGVGVPEHTTWGNGLGRMLGMHMWNLGVGGGSLDTVFRVLEYWLPKLTPKFVAICIPSVSNPLTNNHLASSAESSKL